ncbi:HIT family protein [uncultured Rubinisphaera sp.]|uniref:HIT family protein n=1 Tax=uncultured Rubinisphaera sp. TaxID=1678686 RepID=UPI0030DAEEB1|tara:strand:+ start:137 stop:553 length:417 start_codon:yes stop_codon:yes gene_type:complete
MNLHPQLQADCHHLGQYEICTVLLHKNKSVPWFLLVPETECIDLLDIQEQIRTVVLRECELISNYLKQVQKTPKVNFASLGNVVPQLHIHVIGRHVKDACWPAPVWGNLREVLEYEPEEVESIQQKLIQDYDLRPLKP